MMPFGQHPSGPFYIYVPSMAKRSAGVKVLLKLCRMLIEQGFEAFLIIPYSRTEVISFEGVDLPVLGILRAVSDEENGRNPIVIYPEIVMGNPMNAGTVVRYVLNWPGVLGGDASYDPGEIVYCYTKTLANSIPGAQVLHIPVVDTSVFYDRKREKRFGSCFYAAKFRNLGGSPAGIPRDSVEILRDGTLAQTPEEIAGLFSSCEVFYTFEDTLLSLEAALCGCPTVFVPNEIFEAPFGDQEFGIKTALLGESGCMVRAHSNLNAVQSRYSSLDQCARQMLSDFSGDVRDRLSNPRSLAVMNMLATDANEEISLRKFLYSIYLIASKLSIRVAWRKFALENNLRLVILKKKKRPWFRFRLVYNRQGL